MVEIRDGELWNDELHCPLEAVTGFVERYSLWSGRAWLKIAGPDWVIPIDQHYGAIRSVLRRELPRLPFTSDWEDGRFPSSPMGLPASAVLVAVVPLVALAVASGMWLAGLPGGSVVGLAAVWPLGRLRDHVVIRRDGMRAGPAWAPLVGWHRVESVRIHVGRRRAVLWFIGPDGGGLATVPRALVPAVRGRIRRLGGLEVVPGAPSTGLRYAIWRAPAAGIPWGILLGTCVFAWFTATPWTVMTAGLLAMAATAMLGAAVEARADGWGFGAVAWMTAAYAVVLFAVGLGTSGLLGGS